MREQIMDILDKNINDYKKCSEIILICNEIKKEIREKREKMRQETGYYKKKHLDDETNYYKKKLGGLESMSKLLENMVVEEYEMDDECCSHGNSMNIVFNFQIFKIKYTFFSTKIRKLHNKIYGYINEQEYLLLDDDSLENIIQLPIENFHREIEKHISYDDFVEFILALAN